MRINSEGNLFGNYAEQVAFLLSDSTALPDHCWQEEIPGENPVPDGQLARRRTAHGSSSSRVAEGQGFNTLRGGIIEQAIGKTPQHLNAIINERRGGKRLTIVRASVDLQQQIAAYFDMHYFEFLELGARILHGETPGQQVDKEPEKIYEKVRSNIVPFAGPKRVGASVEKSFLVHANEIVRELREAYFEIERLKNIVEALGEPISVFDANGICTYQNSRSLAFLKNQLGKHYQEIIESTGTRFVDSDESAVERCLMSHSYETSVSLTYGQYIQGIATPMLNGTELIGVVFVSKLMQSAPAKKAARGK